MDNILLISYYFPPLGGAGVGRPLALYKNLSRFGYKCDVLTVKNVTYRFYERELLENLDTKRIYRAGSTDPQRLLYLLGLRRVKDKTISKGKSVSDRYFPDPKIGWVRPAVKLGRVLTENRKYKVVISTSPPMSSHLVAMKLAEEFKVPWIADFRDYWTSFKVEDWFKKPKQVEKGKNLIKKIVSASSIVTGASKGIADYISGGEVIYNSYDPERAKLWQVPLSKDKFRIGILGTVDLLTPVEPLFKIVALLKEKAAELYDKVEMVQVGDIKDGNIENLLAKYDLKDKWITHGIKPREETIKLLSETHLLYLSLSKKIGPGVIPGRFFDVAASGRPILASIPDGYELADLVSQTGNGLCFDDSSYDNAMGYLSTKIIGYQYDNFEITPLPGYSLQYSSEEMTKKFAEIIKRIG